jgi:hypothetical protein
MTTNGFPADVLPIANNRKNERVDRSNKRCEMETAEFGV